MKKLVQLILIIILICFGSDKIFAEDLLVTNGNDSGPGSLRNAVEDADNDDTIYINNIYVSRIDLTSGPIIVDKRITISTHKGGKVLIHANNNSNIFTIDRGNLTLKYLELAGGYNRYGGAIHNDGSLIIYDHYCPVISQTNSIGYNLQ